MAASAFKKFFPAGQGLQNGNKLNRLFLGMDYMGSIANQGTTVLKPQVMTAAGTTQLGAALIGAVSLAVVTVATTASTHGVRLPAAVTGLEVQVANHAAFGVKVYPSTNNQIGAASTNAADSTVLAVNKSNNYIAIDAFHWVVNRGA